MDGMLKDIASCFDKMDARLKAFKKDSYEEAYRDFLAENQGFFTELNRELAEGNEGFISGFAEEVAACGAKVIEREKSKIKKESRQLDVNLYMVVYFLPGILEGKQTGNQELADEICRKWAECFKGSNIKSADFASISSGFRTKLCYITTAAVKSLHKPEDCYELELLRDYRDNCLMQTEEGAKLVERYYDIAPTIVKRIGKTPDAEETYRGIWENYLESCIQAIEDKDMEDCRRIYTRMVEELQRRYMYTNNSTADPSSGE